ncbi:MAG: Mur ligase family protein [Acidimicrobiales bacterium]|nr:Mur ligase family protein [Acidimicrobiales bacterium]
MDELEALDHLDSLINYEVTPRAGAIEGLSLEPMLGFMSAIGDPQDAYPVIHLTGTNGKGSTSRMLERILTVMGLRVGLYTSPHLHDVTERIRVGGESIEADDFGQAIADVVSVEEVQGLGPRTWFDTVTSAALLYFANEAVDVAIVEVGMLGRFDSTNVVHADVAVIANVSLDHSSGGAGWREEIAREKAGIIEAGRPVVIGEPKGLLEIVAEEDPGSVVALGRDVSLDRNDFAVGGRLIDVTTPRGSHEEVFVALHGEHQGINAAVAIAAAEEFFDAPLGEEIVTEAFETVVVPGRLEVVQNAPTVLVDAAHNIGGAEALSVAVREEFGTGARRFLVIGMQDGRDPVAVLGAMDAASYDVVVACTPPTARGIPAEDLARAAETVGARADVVVDVDAAIEHALGLAADDDLVVVAGSTTVVAIALGLGDL